MHDKYSFLLADSATLANIANLTYVARDKQLDVGLNMPGSSSCRLPLDHDTASLVNPLTTCIVVYKGANPIWGGPVWNLTENAIDNSLQINALGWFEMLNHRFIRASASGGVGTLIARRSFAAVQACTIAEALIDEANSYNATGIITGSAPTTQARTITYEQYTTVGSAVQGLSDLESGFDWDIHPTTKTFNMYTTRMSDLPDVKFGYRTIVNNVASFERKVDAVGMATSFYAVGRGGLTGQAGGIDSTYGLLEDTAGLGDVADINVLLAYAGVEVALRDSPIVTLEFTPRPAGVLGTPQPWTDYFVGDKVYVSANQGRLQLSDQAVRVFGITLAIDSEGGSRVTSLRTSPV